MSATQNVGYLKCRRLQQNVSYSKCRRLQQNVSYSKCRLLKMSAPTAKCQLLKMSAPTAKCQLLKMSAPKLLTIWARRTLHSALLLSPAEVLVLLVLKVLLLHLLVLKWDLFSDLPSLYGRHACRTGTAACTGTTCPKHAKMSAP
jgi:hypothetical protein